MTFDEAFDIMIDVAIGLGDGWTVQPSSVEYLSNRFYFYKDNEKTLYASLRYGTNSTFDFSGCYPHRAITRNDDPKAGINVERGASVVASEIKRRILPEVERLITERKLEQAKRLQETKDMEDRATRLGAILGIEPEYRHGEEFRIFVGGTRGLPYQIEVSKYQRTKLTIETNDTEFLAKLSEMIADWSKTRNQ